MTSYTPQNTEGKVALDLEVLVSDEDKAVYVKFTGFEDINEADAYAEHLTEYLPLILFESEVKH
jgi:hypothetical protein